MRIHTIQFQSGSSEMILLQTISYRNKTAKQNEQLSNIFRHIHVRHKKCLLVWTCLSPSLHMSTCTNLAPTEWTFMKFDTGYFYPHFIKTGQKYWALYVKTYVHLYCWQQYKIFCRLTTMQWKPTTEFP